MQNKNSILKLIKGLFHLPKKWSEHNRQAAMANADKGFKSYQARKLPEPGYQVKFVKAEETKAFGMMLCDAYELSGNFTLNDIADFVQEKRNEHPNHRLFATLDDFDQACYTFSHTCRAHLEEDEIEGYWEAEDIRDVLTFDKRVSNFKKHLADTSLDTIFGGGFWEEDSGQTPSVKTQDWLEREKFAYVQIVPVSCAADALISFPNGYFDSDYSPFENYRLAEALEKDFGFEVFGIGASYIGFMRAEAMKGEALDRVASWLSRLFTHENKEQLTSHIRNDLEEKNVFYLCYAQR